MKLNLIQPTVIFSIVGFFFPVPTAMGLVCAQMLLSNLGIECSSAWKIIWKVTTIAGIILPFLFYRLLTHVTSDKLRLVKTWLFFFNLFEFTFIQSSLTPLFTSGQTLCYVSDGQNGLELLFTGWCALPMLIVFSYIFNRVLKNERGID